ncbi:hypothetical protein AUP74_01944 [Microbulbifer aggregans]|uniref:Uncharacterized protein n=1 Tax=Microbulbifer aggregans TaxID=1769779 RepID=A0A1C9W896_9GAMM|nr:hypothetical protein [Microbulbifer aggregans]AOS97374.1 hypothetical protein AUP74_01944 [Microbulbifer aggregans]
MTFSDLMSIATAVIGSIGGSALIVIGASTWLGRVWAGRILEQDRHKYASELEHIKNQLESERSRNQFIFSLYFEGQFRIYNDLWSSLVELQHCVKSLWESASTANVQKLSKSLKEAKLQVQKSALLIEPDHYIEIINALEDFENYRVGKEKLVSIRRVSDIEHWQIDQIIQDNLCNKDRISQFSEEILNKMRGRLRLAEPQQAAG